MSKERLSRLQKGSVWHTDPKLEWMRHRKGGNFAATFVRGVIQFLLDRPGTVLDPFCGTGERTEAAVAAGHGALGLDISQVAIESCLKRWDLIEGFVVADARALPVQSEAVDLVFTSPPYWCVEHYEPCPGQLSEEKTYRRFLVQLGRAFGEMHRVLRPGGFAAVVVANFRRWGAYYPFVFDTQSLLRQVGFQPWDNVVLVRESVGPLGAARAVEHHHTKVAHDELLIVRK